MSGYRALWDWRRAIAGLYGEIRSHAEPAAAHAVWAARRRELFATHPQSPVEPDDRAGFSGPHVYRYAPSLRILVALDAVEAAPVEMDAGSDGVLPLVAFARTIGLTARFGGELTLYWINTYGGGVFLPFRDASSGRGTYGGGRYLLDTIKSADLGEANGRTILDFNFAYYPSCAYSARYVCPLAPPGNRLPASIEGGERDAPDMEGAG